MKFFLLVVVFSVALHVAPGIRVRTPANYRAANVQAANQSLYTIESRIVGGELAAEGSAPYHVALQTIVGSHFCSGVIIDERWILTAGHCVIGWSPTRFLISTGTNDIWGPEAYYFPDWIVVHCNYDKPLYHNDIALIHVESVIEFDAKTQPIPLATELIAPGSKLTLTGWGTTANGGEISQLLQEIQTNYVDYETCKSRYNDDPGVDVGHICSLASAGVGICHGDSGAPLVSDGKLVGIVNWGEPCALNYPDVHANVAFYYEWIRTTIDGCRYSFD